MSDIKQVTMTKKQLLWLVVACAAYLVIRLIPIPGLAPEGQKALAVLGWIIVVLISKCLPTMLANLIFAVLIIVTGVLPQGAFLAAFGTSPFILVLGLSVVALGMSKTNLGARIAYTLIRYVGKTPSLLVLAIMITGTLLSMLIVNLPALLAVCPIILAVLKELNEAPGESRLGKAMFLGLAWSGGIGGLVLISSNGTNAAGVGALAAATEGAVNITYAQWAMLGIPVAILMLIPSWIFLCVWFKVNQSGKRLDPDMAKKRLAELGPMDGNEIRYIVIIVLMIALFFCGGKFGIMPPTVALIAMAVMLLPKVGLVDFDVAQKSINWSMLFQVGFFVGFAGAVAGTGLGDWLANTLVGWATGGSLMVLLLVICMLGHLGTFLVPGGGAAIMLIPSVVAFAGTSGAAPGILALMMIWVSSWSQFQPVQPQYLVVCSNAGGYLDIKDFVIPNIIVTVIWTIITWPAFYLLAPLAGLG